ncbi:hypothetical protein I6F34_01240 [Bradyrhizobium sp. BRP05]|nr:hypothetical protein [Bradyrhizobium sp. BRP05]
MNIHVNTTSMHTVLTHLRNGRTIEAIKEFRVLYGSGLKEAKDAIEAIRDTFMPRGAEPTEYVTISRYEYDHEYQVVRAHSKEEALADANGIVDSRSEVMVAAVIARSVTTRAMKEVA